jgi:hypothetical protein
MRHALMLGVLLALAGCAGSPADLGITGPTPPAPPQGFDDGTVERPGLPDAGAGYGPSVTPSTGGGRYFNYN